MKDSQIIEWDKNLILYEIVFTRQRLPEKNKNLNVVADNFFLFHLCKQDDTFQPYFSHINNKMYLE